MNRKILDLIPTGYFCPCCGKKHRFLTKSRLNDFSGLDDVDEVPKELFLECNDEESCSLFSFEDGYLKYKFKNRCLQGKTVAEGSIKISEIEEDIDIDNSRVMFSVSPVPNYATENHCYNCYKCHDRYLCSFSRAPRLSYDGEHLNIQFGFEFYKDELLSVLEGKEEQEGEKFESEDVINNEQLYQQSQVKEPKKGDATMETTTIMKMLYERSPKENFEVIKEFAERYKPTLEWVVPTAAVYGAYRILKSDKFDLTVNNVADMCEEKLGIKLEFLENKTSLKEMMAIGGIVAGTYGVSNVISEFFSDKKENKPKDFLEELEGIDQQMNKLESISNKFSWMQPKMGDMLPIAFSVIFVYVTLNKPKFEGKIANKISNFTEDFQVKISTYIEFAKMFIADKFDINLSDEEGQRKMRICASLIVFVGIFVLLYGKRVLVRKNNSEKEEEVNKNLISSSVEKFVEQAKAIIKNIAPTVYTTLISLLISKKLLEGLDEYDEFCFDSGDEEEPEDDDEFSLDSGEEGEAEDDDESSLDSGEDEKPENDDEE